MSDFNDAKLILTPNAYKAGKAYSLKPFDGSGDLTVVRNTTATRVNENGLIEAVAVNVPRVNYPIGGGCPSWLIEPQSTNLLNYSEDFNAWSKVFTTIDTDTITSPDNQLTADKLVETTNNGQHRVQRAITGVGGTIYFLSVFAKKSERNVIGLRTGNNGSTKRFDLELGVALDADSLIIEYGNGWYRCVVFEILSSSGTMFSRINIYENSTTSSYVGDGVSGVYLWGVQLEEGSLSSYIPTNGSTVTRNADVFQSLNVQNFVGATEGTIYFKLKNAIAHSSTNKIMGLDDGSGGVSNFFGLYVANASTGQVAIRNRQANVDLTNTNIPNPENAKIAIKFSPSGIKTFLNGSLFQESTTAYSGFIEDLVFNPFNGLIELESLILFDTAKTDAELINLTTI